MINVSVRNERKKYHQRVICTSCGRLAHTRLVGGGPKIIDGACASCLLDRVLGRLGLIVGTKDGKHD